MSESKKAFSADTSAKCRTHVGGQALIEGVMMRGRRSWALAVREPSGNIYTEQHDLISGRKKNSWLLWPIIRGCTAFVESLVLGFKALNIASEHAYDWDEEDEAKNKDEASSKADGTSPDTGSSAPESSAVCADEFAPIEEQGKTAPTEKCGNETALTEENQGKKTSSEVLDKDAEAAKNRDKKSSAAMNVAMMISIIFGILLGVAIFVVVPAALSNLVLGSETMNTAAWNVLDGILRVLIFIAYIWLIGKMKDIKRMFSYHGAEHKTIHCFEHGLELTPANAQQFPTLHVRCGTAFLIMVMIIAIFIYTVLGHPINMLIDLTGVTTGILRFLLVILTRIILLPLIAGCSYEITVKWAGSRPDNPLVRIILWPGMQMQKLTTNQPDDSMLECAIIAMKMVLDKE